MKSFLRIVLICVVVFVPEKIQCQKNVSDCFRKDFLKVIKNYIRVNNKFKNPCHIDLLYEIQFYYNNDTLEFAINANIVPSIIPPIKEGYTLSIHKKEIKGFNFINGRKVIIFDFKESEGYGLYNVNKLEKFNKKDFDDYHEICTHIKYPDIYIYNVVNKTITFSRIEPGYYLQ